MTRPDENLRTERIEAIRREIAAGTYDTPARLEAALDAFLDRREARRPVREDRAHGT